MATHQALETLGVDPVFRATAAPYLILDPQLRIRAANPAYQQATHTTEDDLQGAYLFDAFPDDPANPEADGRANLSTSIQQVLSKGQRHYMGIQRYDVPDPADRTRFVKKVWRPLNMPILGHDRRVIGIIHHVEDITELCTAWEIDHPDDDRRRPPQQLQRLTTALSRLRETHRALLVENEQLRQAMGRRGVIEQAKGILMGQRHCTADEAFAILVGLSQDTNTKLYDVARSLIDDTVGR